jgi:hypothetical protein
VPSRTSLTAWIWKISILIKRRRTKLEDSHLRFFVAKMKCAHCGQPYSSSSISMVGDFSEFIFYQVTCSVCGMQTMVTAVVAKEPVSESLEGVTDKEAKLFGSTTRASSSYIIDRANYMKYFNGDFSQIFTS